MQVHELRWLLAVVEEPNLTRAAASESISQPALSRALRRIEKTVGAPLFDRVGRGLEPNPRGRAFAEHVERALQELQAGVDAVRDAVDPAGGEVHLGFLHTFGTWLVPELVSSFRADRPGVTLHLRQDAAERLLEELVDGRQDMVITSPDPRDPRLSWSELFVEPVMLLVPPEHRLAGRRRIALAEVTDEPFVLMQRGNGLRTITDTLFAATDISPAIAFEGQDVETLKGLVRAGLGLTIVPARSVRAVERGTIALRDSAAARTVGLCLHRERTRPPAADALAELIKATARTKKRRPVPTRDG